MSAETVTLEIHRERLDGKSAARPVLAKKTCDAVADVYPSSTLYACWHDFEWWCEIPAPVKPKRFVVESNLDYEGRWLVRRLFDNQCVANWTPTREAAQRIADIYEETTP